MNNAFKLMTFKDAKAAGLTTAEGLGDNEMVAVATEGKGFDAVERQPESGVELPVDDSGREATEG